MRKTALERFTEKIEIDSLTNCHNWIGPLNKYGYGRLYYVNKKEILAHRFAYQTFIGSTDNFHVLHKCDNRRCVNVNHLFLGTNKDNVQDKVLKNRQTKGEQIFQSKLNLNQVKEIKIALQNPYWGINNDLAKKYNVSPASITFIKKNKNWSHLSTER